MELPAPLRARVAEILDPVPLADLRAAGAALSRRYRAETLDGRLHLSDDLAAKAYLATRLPATYAAVRAAIAAVEETRPDFRPASLLDVGAGPGTVLHAALDAWPALGEARLLEASPAIRRLGERLAEDVRARVRYESRDLLAEPPAAGEGRADLVAAAYLLDELPEARRPSLVSALFAATRDVLLIVEPGTPAGWRRILEARTHLLAEGARVLAPCPHERPCPIVPPDWCHFARRLARSRLHRLAKDGDSPFEDEKFAYVAVSRTAGLPVAARVLARPRAGSGRVAMKLCRRDGVLDERLVTKREGEAFREVRRADWGDTLGLSGES